MSAGHDLNNAINKIPLDSTQTLGQVMAELIHLTIANPEQIERIARVARHVAHTHAIADDAIQTLVNISRHTAEIKQNLHHQHNIGLIVADFERISDSDVSHGGDI